MIAPATASPSDLFLPAPTSLPPAGPSSSAGGPASASFDGSPASPASPVLFSPVDFNNVV